MPGIVFFGFFADGDAPQPGMMETTVRCEGIVCNSFMKRHFF
jgi:hypothetical protein